MTFIGSSCLSSSPSGLSLLHCPGLPPSACAGSPLRASQFFRNGTGHRVEATNPWHSDSPLEPASCRRLFRRLVRSLSLRPPSLLPSRAGQTRGTPLGLPRLVLPDSQASGSPRMPTGYAYDTKLSIASAGLSPASTAASPRCTTSMNRSDCFRLERQLAGQVSHLLGGTAFPRRTVILTCLPTTQSEQKAP